ncbi:Succinyl-3-ketoacid coenzyme A transferase [Hyphodiscus hymeniophilus]|uniref:Succinyl-CoA:3-ketoacid-coenzyme A transferase n=1 Tax=Hyphodiscus hymeniophilus TaxID=353542 RepID=A0A9P6VEN5_9HELO|nr:Succinyl-3-ketoacid coenzyme A transferase [Hyphodiscus hymeniophilus]
MATRRIPALLLPSSPRNAFITPSRFPRRLAPLARQFTTTELRKEQQKANTSAKRDPAPKIVRGQSKLYKDADAAVADLKSGSTILSAGFGLCGTAARGGGLSPLVDSGQISRLTLSFLGNNKSVEKKYLSGDIAVELCPQGTIAERIRAAGAGIPAFFTPTGINTFVQTGEIPVRFGPSAKGEPLKVLEAGKARETREFNGKTYSMEHALPGDVAILRAWKVDEEGNCQFRYTTKAFGPIMAKAAKVTIVEAENIVPVGEIPVDQVHLQGIYVDRIVPATVEPVIEIRKVRESESGSGGSGNGEKKSDALVRRERIAKRTSKELKHGYYVNLGVGIPTLAPSFLDPETKVWIQSENGLLGMGAYPTEDEIDGDLVNAGKETVTVIPGGSTFDSAESFAMIRGGHVDVSVLGALQVSAAGDLANYMIPGKVMKGMGGAMDLVGNPDQTKIVVSTDHVAKDGSPKIVQVCDLPLTGARVVSTIITDLCVFEVDRKKGALTLTELADGVTVEDVRSKTAAEFEVADNVKNME